MGGRTATSKGRPTIQARAARPEDPFALNLARIVHRLVTSPRGWRVDELKTELGVADRTYRKYRGYLRERFAPFRARGKSLVREVKDGDARYLRLVPGDSIGIGSSDLVASMAALHLAREAFRFLGGTELKKALDDLHADLCERVTDKKFVLDHLLRNLGRMLHCVPDAPKDYGRQGSKLRAILEGLVFTRQIAIEHEGGTGRRRHELEPLTLMLYRSALYLVGRHVGSRRPYTFAIDRIVRVETLKTGFRYPSEKDFSPAGHFDGAFGIFLPSAETKATTDVELVFANERWLKLYVRERRWHPTQKFRDLKDGRLRMTFRVDSMVEVWPWIRSFGKDVKVLTPAEK